MRHDYLHIPGRLDYQNILESLVAPVDLGSQVRPGHPGYPDYQSILNYPGYQHNQHYLQIR